MTDDRPNPDELLAHVREEEAKSRRGKLKIFFGYAAGVGKTYAMLEAARREKAAGIDVVVGYVEPHGRKETEALLDGLEQIPNLSVPYRDVTLREFDLDAALARKPALLLVDELAHSNADGCRHSKRWQDVQELLAAGIDVYSTLNVQHIESLNDVIAQITHIVVRETLPDSVIEKADEIELVDITPDELIDRLREGKVYVPSQAERAIRHFFQPHNLMALRELSLRAAAKRLQQDVDEARSRKAAAEPWATTERLLVCVGPSPTATKVIRAAKRMASALDADWLAVAVSLNDAMHTPAAVRDGVARNLRLAESLGAETHVLVGQDVSRTIVRYANSRNVTKIVVGKTAEPWWRRFIHGSVVDKILDRSGEIDVYVIHGEADQPVVAESRRSTPAIPWIAYLNSSLVVACAVLINLWIFSMHSDVANIVMVFLLGVGIVSAWFGRDPAVAAAIASVLLFDFLFTPPYYTFAMQNTQHVVTFGVMLAIGLFISALTARLREQVGDSQERARRTESLYRLSKQLGEASGVDFLVSMAGRQIEEIFHGTAVIYLSNPNKDPILRYGEKSELAGHAVNPLVARWVIEHGQSAGAGTDTLPNATALFVPLVGSQKTVGAMGVQSDVLIRDRDPDQRRMLDACASQIALAIERDQLALEAYESKLDAESERLRSSLLSSVSHDLRTPLAAIEGASTSLLEATATEESRKELLQTIVDESHRLARLVDNLLDMTRLESGSMKPRREWHVLEEIVGSALARLARLLSRHEVDVSLPADLPLVSVDGLLIEQLLVNLLENAARYTPKGSRIDVSARSNDKTVMLSVVDNGPGLPPGTEQRVFDKFFRGTGRAPDGYRGVGLGLAICKAIATAHGGSISARNRPEGGAEFTLHLPATESPPTVTLDEPARTNS